MKKILIILLLAFSGLAAHSQIHIRDTQASAHIGDSVIVTGKVFGGKLLSSGMTLINIGADFPDHLLSVMIKAEDRFRFLNKPEEQLIGKEIQVSGLLLEFKGKPEIIVNSPGQIRQITASDSAIPDKKIVN